VADGQARRMVEEVGDRKAGRRCDCSIDQLPNNRRQPCPIAMRMIGHSVSAWSTTPVLNQAVHVGSRAVTLNAWSASRRWSRKEPKR
jgi:hypothetical protein